MTQSNVFKKLRGVIVSVKVEKKGKFNYLSWADAVDYLLEDYPSATWNVHEWDNLPYTGTPEHGYMVAVTVTIEGIPRTQHHPVLNHSNKTIFKPNVFEINTAIQRCLAKAIALHGLGLSLYTGEDLVDPPKNTTDKPQGGSQGTETPPVDIFKDKMGKALKGFIELKAEKEFFNVLGVLGYDNSDGVPVDKQREVLLALSDKIKEMKESK